ncbi:YeeE/YedE family protein [Thalassotalea fusca]
MLELLMNYSAPLFGGILIGLSALLLMISIGRIAGISGIATAAMNSTDGSGRLWRWLFLLGLLIGALIYSQTWELALPFRQAPPAWVIVVAGLLVGFGTHWGSGCTSGHGVCGIGRFSIRSVIATLIFMFFAAVTVFIARHVLGG